MLQELNKVNTQYANDSTLDLDFFQCATDSSALAIIRRNNVIQISFHNGQVGQVGCSNKSHKNCNDLKSWQ